MTKRNKITLISSVALAAIVIFSTLVWAFNSSSPSNTMKLPVILYALIIFISMLSVSIVYYSKIKKKNFEKHLNDEYIETYQIIKDAIGNSQLSKSIKKDINEDVLDLLLSAQKNGKMVKNVIGDQTLFTQEIIRSYASKSKLALLSFIDSMIALVLMILGANTLNWLENTSQNYFSIGLDLSMMVFFVLVAFVILPVTKRLTSTKYSWAYFIPLIGGIVFIIIVELMRRNFIMFRIIDLILNGTIRMIPNASVFLFYIILIPVLLFVKKYIRQIFFQL